MSLDKFFSFRWQTLIAMSLIIVTGVSLLLLNITSVLKSQLYSFSSKQHEIYHNSTQLQFEQLKSSMLQTASLLSHTEMVSENWFDYTIDPGFDIIAHFDNEAKLLSFVNNSFNSSQLHTTNTQKRLLNISLMSESPDFAIDCQMNQCALNLAYPFFKQDKNVEILLLSLPLNQYFNKNTLPLFQVLLKPDMSKSMTLNQWQYIIESPHTNPEIRELFKEISHKKTLSDLKNKPFFHNQNQETFLISITKISDTYETEVPILFIEQFSDETSFIDDTLQQYLFTALVGTIIALLFQFFYFKSPLKRLNKISSILPKLAEEPQPTQLTQNIVKQRNLFVDEFSTIEGATLSLADTLEKLRKRIKQQQDKIQLQMTSLASEKMYIEHLMNSIPSIILILDSDGKVIQFNDFARSHLHSLTRLDMHPFIELLVDKKEKDVFSQYLNSTYIQTTSKLELESKLPNAEAYYLWRIIQLKDIQSHRMNHVAIGLDISERYRYEMELYQFANFDNLTGLNNRRAFFDELNRLISQSMRRNAKFCLLYIDLNKFKRINDEAGHQYGDQMLKAVSQSLKVSTRQSDFVSRLGGDEFAILLPDTETSGAEVVAQHIIKSVNSIQIQFKDLTFKGSVSIGIAECPTHSADPEVLIHMADQAMYQSKQKGESNYHIASETDGHSIKNVVLATAMK